ncbi:MAG: hypothetical protein AB7S86_18485 [Hydrogenophaga sp.]
MGWSCPWCGVLLSPR